MKFRNLGVWDVLKKADFWKKFSEKHGADFKIKTTVSKDLNRLEMTIQYNGVSISFSESDTRPLFIDCNFKYSESLAWFEISKIDFIEKVIAMFGKNKISSYNKDFNRKYLVKTVDNYRVKSIINNKNITGLILKQNLTYIGGKQDKSGAFHLTVNVHRNVNSLEQLETVYGLATALIDELKGHKKQRSQTNRR